VVLGDVLYSPLDDKPKSIADPRRLRRVQNLLADPRATILIDQWSEDWSRLAYVEIACRGLLVEPGRAEHDAAIVALREKYPQYRTHRLEQRPLLRFSIGTVTAWSAAEPAARRGTAAGAGER
jgi:PPOX class probable F420-dependent enzyme